MLPVKANREKGGQYIKIVSKFYLLLKTNPADFFMHYTDRIIFLIRFK